MAVQDLYRNSRYAYCSGREKLRQLSHARASCIEMLAQKGSISSIRASHVRASMCRFSRLLKYIQFDVIILFYPIKLFRIPKNVPRSYYICFEKYSITRFLFNIIILDYVFTCTAFSLDLNG